MMNRASRKGQSILEMTVSLVAVFILFFGATKMFVWFNERMVQRQREYEKGRVEAANSGALVEVDESALPPLNIFGE